MDRVDRIFLGGFSVSLMVGVLMICVDPAVVAIVAYLAAIAFCIVGGRYAMNHAPIDPESGRDSGTE